jgi:hypothetical protein
MEQQRVLTTIKTYNEQADLLCTLALQVVPYLLGALCDGDEVRDVFNIDDDQGVRGFIPQADGAAW